MKNINAYCRQNLVNGLIIIGISSIISCGHWGWEDMESDHESQLNVFAMIMMGTYDTSFVRVQQSIELDELEEEFYFYDTTFYGPDSILDISVEKIYKSTFEVFDATVYITDGIDTTYFYFENYYFNRFDRAVYRDTLHTFHPKPNTTYYLYVSTPDGRAITGNTTTPPYPTIHSQQVPDTLYNTRTFSIPYKPMNEDIYLRIKTFGLSGYWYCGTNRLSPIPEDSDTIWVSKVVNCRNDYWSEPDEMIDTMYVQLQAIDENYYEYFIKHSGEEEFIDFILGGEGTSGRKLGIEGGYGVFGSIATDEIIRIYVP